MVSLPVDRQVPPMPQALAVMREGRWGIKGGGGGGGEGGKEGSGGKLNQGG